jgi:hypothetical protein
MLTTPNTNIMKNTDYFDDQDNGSQNDWNWRSVIEMKNDKTILVLLRLTVVYFSSLCSHSIYSHLWQP